MDYEQILPLFLDILKNMHLNADIYRESCGSVQEFDYGIRKIAFPSINYQEHMRRVCASCSPNVIYKMFDEFGMDYVILMLPEQEEQASFPERLLASGQRVIVHIDSDLTADLSLRRQAELLKVNATNMRFR